MGHILPRDVPFKRITGLPERAQFEIERDFIDVLEQITPTPSVFDAIIDPELSASDPGTHQYVNLTELVANETWASHELFNIGVVERGATQIVEALGSGSLDVTHVGDIALFGLADFTGGVGSRLAWDWTPLNMNVGQMLFLHNLSFTITVEAA